MSITSALAREYRALAVVVASVGMFGLAGYAVTEMVIGIVGVNHPRTQAAMDAFNSASPEDQYKSVARGLVEVSCKDKATGLVYRPTFKSMEEYRSKDAGCWFDVK